MNFMSLDLFVAAYLVAGYDIVLRAKKNMFNGQLFDLKLSDWLIATIVPFIFRVTQKGSCYVIFIK